MAFPVDGVTQRGPRESSETHETSAKKDGKDTMHQRKIHHPGVPVGPPRSYSENRSATRASKWSCGAASMFGRWWWCPSPFQGQATKT